jgi:hypothetical protein
MSIATFPRASVREGQFIALQQEKKIAVPATPEEEIKKYKFLYAGKILKEPKGLSFDLQENFAGKGKFANTPGWVYLWIKVNKNGRFDVCYVGMTTKTLKGRCDQHKNGFRNSMRGKAFAKFIRRFFKEDATVEIHVYAHISGKRKILGEEVSMCEAEERAMIKKLGGTDLWNKIGYKRLKLLGTTGSH